MQYIFSLRLQPFGRDRVVWVSARTPWTESSMCLVVRSLKGARSGFVSSVGQLLRFFGQSSSIIVYYIQY